MYTIIVTAKSNQDEKEIGLIIQHANAKKEKEVLNELEKRHYKIKYKSVIAEEREYKGE